MGLLYGARIRVGKTAADVGRAVRNLKNGRSRQVLVAENGRCQKTSRCEVVMVQLVDQPAGAGLAASTILADVLKEIEKKAGLSPAEIG